MKPEQKKFSERIINIIYFYLFIFFTKNKHAASINNSRMMISWGRWGSSGEGSVAKIKQRFKPILHFPHKLSTIKNIIKHKQKNKVDAYRHHEQSFTSKRSRSFSIYLLLKDRQIINNDLK